MKYRVWYDHRSHAYFNRLIDCWDHIRSEDRRPKYDLINGELSRVYRRLYRRKTDNGRFDSIDIYLSRQDMKYDRDGSHPFASIQRVDHYKGE